MNALNSVINRFVNHKSLKCRGRDSAERDQYSILSGRWLGIFEDTGVLHMNPRNISAWNTAKKHIGHAECPPIHRPHLYPQNLPHALLLLSEKGSKLQHHWLVKSKTKQRIYKALENGRCAWQAWEEFLGPVQAAPLTQHGKKENPFSATIRGFGPGKRPDSVTGMSFHGWFSGPSTAPHS